jgi:hypothetical protein
LIFQNDGKSSYNFPAKILGFGTPLFLFNKEFYFPLISLLVYMPHNRTSIHIVSNSSVGGTLAYSVQIPHLHGSTTNCLPVDTDVQAQYCLHICFAVGLSPVS